ncbi:uncharacterized protein LOC135700690 [Ochlerotatus camptorhynchus]|uniref:uncharacterized protein LOC135700690 n=1 Tax=Ochlerotatus camptorhynchus TaxID=644619 RepID=UPI0031CE45D3
MSRQKISWSMIEESSGSWYICKESSSIALGRKKKLFVFLRKFEELSTVLENTSVNEWRWVPSESNAADEATKWGSGPYFSSDSKWFNGPEFLRFPEHEWPNSTDLVVDTAVEVRSSVLFHTTWEPVIAYERFSKWERLQRSIIEPDCSGEGYSSQRALSSNPAKKASVHGTSGLTLSSALPSCKLRNGSERSPPAVHHTEKQIGRSCQFCKIRKAPPMAPLPPARLAIHDRPFSYVGVDYFGPLLVKQGRLNVKRWIALFTCLTVRAVHLEVAYSLSAASCISCIRRFVCRRGSPVEFFSDNATNFHGAERQLRGQIDEGVSATFTSANTKWTFIPPSAPHMGGAWERLVRSVKAAIGDAYREGKLNDEELQTVIVEAEGIVNTRPVTYLPLDSAESESLTPNHFLLGSSNGVKQPSVCIEPQQGISRDLWNHIQRQLNRFWQRWLKEYLPVIRRQTKWYDEVRCVQDGDLVLIANEGKRNGWTRGIVIESIRAPDGHVRQAMIKTAGGVLRRPVSKLVVLYVSSSSAVIEASGPHSG